MSSVSPVNMLKVEQDDGRWIVAGYGSFWFSTQGDAEVAIGLAQAAVTSERDRIMKEINTTMARMT